MSLPKNEKPRSKPEKKKLKPVRAWAVVASNSSLLSAWPVKEYAVNFADECEGETVVRVLITELD